MSTEEFSSVKKIFQKELRILEKFGFYRGQGSVYLSTNNNMANILRALNALKGIDWFKNSIRDIRAFRIEDWSDFTSFIKED